MIQGRYRTFPSLIRISDTNKVLVIGKLCFGMRCQNEPGNQHQHEPLQSEIYKEIILLVSKLKLSEISKTLEKL